MHKTEASNRPPENAFEAFFARRSREGLGLILPMVAGLHAFAAAAYWFTAPYEQALDLAAFSILVTVAAGAVALLARRHARYTGVNSLAACVLLLAYCGALAHLQSTGSPLAVAGAAILVVGAGLVCTRRKPLTLVHAAMHGWWAMLAGANGWTAPWLELETALLAATAVAWACFYSRRTTAVQWFDSQQRLASQGQRDLLTSLPIRPAIVDRLGECLARQSRNPVRTFGLCVLNLDGFRRVNEQHGHANGDLLLQTVAERLRLACRRTDVIARLGGDEFAILLDEAPTPEQADAGADRICAQTCAPIDLDGVPISVTASYGVVWSGADFKSAEAMLSAAHKEMEASKAGYHTVAKEAAAHKRVRTPSGSVALASIA